MLQLSKSQFEANRESAASEILSAAQALEFFISFVRQQFFVILFVTLLTATLGAMYLFTARPSFTAQTQLMIDTRKVQLFATQSILGDNPIDMAQVLSQVEVLRSENIASAVIKDLHLTEDPEFVGSGGGLLGALYKAILDAFVITDLTPPSDFETFRKAMSAFQDRLSVNRVGLTYIIDIEFQSYNAERAAQIANAVADAYILDQLEAKYQATRRTSVWLQDRIKELRDQYSAADRAVVEFRAKNNIVSTGGADRPLLDQQRVAELNTQLTIARAQSSEARARLDRINSVLKQDLPDTSLGGTVTDTLRSEVVSKLRSQYLDLAARESDWSVRYGRDHLAVVNLRNQMREIRNSIFEELKRLGETYKSDFEIAAQREESTRNELALAVSQTKETDAKSVTLRELESTAQTYKTIYDNFLQRYMEAVQQQSFPITESRVISAASRPLLKSSPKTALVLAIALVGGMSVGFGVGIFRKLSDRVFRSSDQVESKLQADCIALMPLLKTKLKVHTSKSSGPKTIIRDNSVLWTVSDAPLSRFTEAVRSIKLAADLDEDSKGNRAIGVTSSVPNEGKSMIAFSFAQLTAKVGARAILIDCDLRNPSLSRLLAPRAKSGLLDVISQKLPLEEAIWKDPPTNMAFLPVVTKRRLVHSSEILSSDSMRKLFESLRERYDYIIVDLPPIAPIIDARATMRLLDSFVFVVEWGRTNIEVAKHAISGAEGIYDKLLGVVLNKVNMDIFGRYSSDRKDYYYNEHYSRYGYTD